MVPLAGVELTPVQVAFAVIREGREVHFSSRCALRGDRSDESVSAEDELLVEFQRPRVVRVLPKERLQK